MNTQVLDQVKSRAIELAFQVGNYADEITEVIIGQSVLFEAVPSCELFYEVNPIGTCIASFVEDDVTVKVEIEVQQGIVIKETLTRS